MNLYDLMWPVAVAVGLGASYGATKVHGPMFWASLAVGALLGIGTFLALRKVTDKVSERALPLFYIGTPICVLAMTTVTAWAIRANV